MILRIKLGVITMNVCSKILESKSYLFMFYFLFYSEPDSTYFELPQPGHSGDRVATSSLPNNRSEVCMGVYHMRDMNDNVMVRKIQKCLFVSNK